MRLMIERLASCYARPALAAVLVISMLSMAATHAADSDTASPASPGNESSKPPAPQVGLVTNDPKAFQGYNLLAPLNSTQTFLFDMQGRVVRTWQSDCSPALCAYLLNNGHILRGGSIGVEAQVFGPGPGVGGRVQEFSWDGEPVWDFRFYNARQLPHHDLTPLPNGNIVMIVWDRKTADEALAAGRRPELTADSHLLVDSLIEIKPTGPTTGDIVWQWHLWDHVVQDFDKSKPNYGNVAEHPELVNLNYGEDALAPIAATKDGADKLKSVGYVGAAAPPGRPRANPDWTHCNGLAYNADLDQIIVSVHAFSEFWIVDHSTTTAEAASHAGGRSGKGGDLLYRWGNPRAYRAGKKEDQKLFAQHNAHWIGKGLPGEGHVLVFNNGGNRPDGSYSSVDELVLPVDAQGRYVLGPGGGYGPDSPVWSYTAPKKTDFYSFFISGAQRLPSGNTLICSGATGVMFEVTPDKQEVVWKYVNPLKAGMGSPGGFAAPPPPGQIMTSTVRTLLAISPEQAKKLDALQHEVDGRLAKLLTGEQQKQLKTPQAAKMAGFGASFQTGQVLTPGEQSRLKLTDDQKKELAEIQKEIDAKIEPVLTEAQRKQSKIGFAFGGPPPGGAGGPGAPPRLGELLPAPVREGLKLTDEQKRQTDDLQKVADARLEKLLTDDQQKQLNDPKTLGALSPPGQLMSPALQARLKLTSDQKKQLRTLQGEADKKLAEMFTEEQKKQFQQMQANVGGLAGRPGGPPAGPGGPGGRPGGPPGGPNFPSNPVFRLYRFAPDHPGLAGKNLTPGKTIEEMQANEADQTAQTAARSGRVSAAGAHAE